MKINNRLLFVLCSLHFSFFIASAPAATGDAYMHYMQGLAEERAGNVGKALEAYQRVVAQDPQAVEVFRDIATLQMRLGHAPEALEAADKARALAPKNPDSFIFIGNLYVAQGNLAKAADAYESALKLDPTNLNALENLGNYYSLVDPEKAVQYYNRYLDVNPYAGDMVFQLGLVSQRLGKLDQALAQYDRAIKIDERQIGPLLGKAEVYEQRQSTAAAEATYLKALEMQPGNPMVAMRLGHLYYRSARWDEATVQFLNVRQAAPKDATVLYWLARVEEERKNWGKSAAYIEEAYTLSQDPQFLSLAAYYFTLDRSLKKAIAWLERARRADPKNPNTLLFLGMNYLELNQLKDAQTALIEGIALDPKDPQLHFHLGVTEDRLGNRTESEKQFSEVLALDPQHAAAMNYQGYTWADHNIRLEEAEKLLREAVRLDADNAAYLDSLGWVLFRRGKLEEAQTHLRKATELNPDPLILDHLGDVYFARENYESAQRVWSQASAIDPKNEAIAKKLAAVSDRVLATVDPRRVMKTIEGNFRQIGQLKSAIAIQVRLGRTVKAQGEFTYQRPDYIRLLVTIAKQPGPVMVELEGKKLKTDSKQALPGASPESLADIHRYFSGELMKDFDGAKTVVEKKAIRYEHNGRRAWVDAERGVLTRYERPSTAGGKDEIEILKYVFEEGLWLPVEMRLRNRDSGWEVRLEFQKWATGK